MMIFEAGVKNMFEKIYIWMNRMNTQGIFKKDATFITRKTILHYIIINVFICSTEMCEPSWEKMYKFYIKLVWNLSIFTLNIFFLLQTYICQAHDY